ncbi:DUF192 domain-containing protein [Halobacteriales archaeon QH_7_65_31]|nr:MAG: DUF192 domain-containing protein [Halobacteriales archaeon QH_7_65_31]
MNRRQILPALGVVLALLVVGYAAGLFAPLLTTGGYQPVAGPTATPTEHGDGGPTATATPYADGYTRTSVTITDGETNATLGSVRAAVAETGQQKYTGLSKTESLPENRGMLFPYDGAADRTYVMRGMDFGIDIVYIDANGTITEIHHAPEPPEGEDGEQYRYPGYGQYVLELNYEWTTRHDVQVGDTVRLGEW